MAPLAGDAVGTGQQLAVHHHAAAAAGAEDHAEHAARAGAGAVDRLGQREAVGVVVQAQLAAERALEVLLERLAVHPGRVAVAQLARGRRQRARMADADRQPRGAGRGLERLHQLRDRDERAGVVAARRGDALAVQDPRARAEQRGFDFGAADVNADAHRPILRA